MRACSIPQYGEAAGVKIATNTIMQTVMQSTVGSMPGYWSVNAKTIGKITVAIPALLAKLVVTIAKVKIIATKTISE